ncbi:hypothetical protein GAY20_11915 [Pantoea dispersa]|uniref:anti-sigma factor n=1 Tax=Pantoea dispersa TaxID=59814 RepID=UPI001266BD8A|nr:anti-sigma factor [Pantoea dispersa]QFS60916.1 hypothetical protein GAY20_11915 [Pantoea dispersa]
MSDKVQRDDALAAEYALGTLRGSARLRFQRRLQAEPALAAQVARWQTLLAGLDQVQPPVTLPETLWKKIALSLPPDKRVAPARRTLPWLAAACVALGLALTAYWLREPVMTPLAVLTDAQHSQQWVVSASRRQDVISLAPLQVSAVRADQSLELWLIPHGRAPVSLGLVTGSAPQQYPIEKQQSLVKATLAISLEPHGGSPTGRPTGPVLYSVNL